MAQHVSTVSVAEQATIFTELADQMLERLPQTRAWPFDLLYAVDAVRRAAEKFTATVGPGAAPGTRATVDVGLSDELDVYGVTTTLIDEAVRSLGAELRLVEAALAQRGLAREGINVLCHAALRAFSRFLDEAERTGRKVINHFVRGLGSTKEARDDEVVTGFVSYLAGHDCYSTRQAVALACRRSVSESDGGRTKDYGKAIVAVAARLDEIATTGLPGRDAYERYLLAGVFGVLGRQVPVDLEQKVAAARAGGLTEPVTFECGDCAESVAPLQERGECPRCGGTGSQPFLGPYFQRIFRFPGDPCEACEGTGRCAGCDGTGVLAAPS